MCPASSLPSMEDPSKLFLHTIMPPPCTYPYLLHLCFFFFIIIIIIIIVVEENGILRNYLANVELFPPRPSSPTTIMRSIILFYFFCVYMYVLYVCMAHDVDVCIIHVYIYVLCLSANVYVCMHV